MRETWPGPAAQAPLLAALSAAGVHAGDPCLLKHCACCGFSPRDGYFVSPRDGYFVSPRDGILSLQKMGTLCLQEMDTLSLQEMDTLSPQEMDTLSLQEMDTFVTVSTKRCSRCAPLAGAARVYI